MPDATDAAQAADSDAARAWETLFWMVFERSPKPMALISEELEYVAVNPMHCQVFGRPSDKVVGTTLYDYLPEDVHGALQAEADRFLEDGELNAESTYVTVDGEVVHLQFAACGDVVGFQDTACSESAGGRRVGLFVTHVVGEDTGNGTGAADGEGLSPREREVVQLVALGKTSRDIADELSVSIETVRTHIRNALAKTGTRTRAQLVAQVMARRPIAGA